MSNFEVVVVEEREEEGGYCKGGVKRLKVEVERNSEAAAAVAERSVLHCDWNEEEELKKKK